MELNEAKKLVRELREASIQAWISDGARVFTAKEVKAAWKILTALTDSPVSQSDVEDAIG